MSRDRFLPRSKKSENCAKALRKNLTKEEKHLWYDFLRQLPVHFYRQYTIENYIVDFFCPKANLVIEQDGSQHYESDTMRYDAKRTEVLQAHDLIVLRYTNRDVNERFSSVCDSILEHIKEFV